MGNAINYGIVGVFSLVLGMGGSIMLTKDQIDHGYVCNSTEAVGFFDNLSSTGKTGYWNGGSAQCRNGKWVPLRTYALARGINIDMVINQNIQPDGIKFVCNVQKCEAVD